MYARVTKFTGATREQIAAVTAGVDEAEGPPPGVPSSGLKLLVNEDEGTVIFVGFFETEEDLKTGDAALRDFTPPGGVPGMLESIDLCEVKVEKAAP
jgi:hypothetical protein